MKLQDIFSEMDEYGFNTLIRDYCKYPSFLPLPCHWEHGWVPRNGPLYWDLMTKRPLMLVLNKRRLKYWRSNSKIRAVIGGTFFIHHRKSKHIVQNLKAKGTIVFPAHSSSLIDYFYDIDKYCDALKHLPSNLQPITICLHKEDLRLGRNKDFIIRGFKVVCAGDYHSSDYADHFYNLLRRYKYSTSNILGTYILYAIEMGLPFFLFGKTPRMNNFGKDLNVIYADKTRDRFLMKRYKELFKYPKNSLPIITAKQLEFVQKECGVDDSLSPSALRMELYLALAKLLGQKFKYYSSPYNLFNLIKEVSFEIIIRLNRLKEISKIPTHLSRQEKITLFKLASCLPKDSVNLEIGSYLGASACFLSEGLIKSGGGCLYCVDTWDNRTMPDGIQNTWNSFQASTKSYINMIHPLRGLSNLVHSKLPVDSSFDLIFFDGDHSYRQTKQDWLIYKNTLKNNSILVFHDTGWAIGVQKVIREYVSNYSRKIINLPNMQVYVWKV